MSSKDNDNTNNNETKNNFLSSIKEKAKHNPPDVEIKTNIVDIKQKDEIDLSQCKSINFTELSEIVPKELEYIAHPILTTQGLAMIYAASGVGKTQFCLNLAYVIAQGGRFLKYECPEPRKVLYVDGEMPFVQMHNRIMDIHKSHGKLYFPENFNIITPETCKPFPLPKIDEEQGQGFYEEKMDRENIELIIIDNISMLTSIDENKSCEWKIIQDWLLRLRSKGKSVVLIHHSGKDKVSYRGTSRMLDCLDTAISLQPIDDINVNDDDSAGMKFKVEYQKHRQFFGKESLPFEVELIKNNWSLKSSNDSDMERAADLYNSGLTQRDIAKDFKCSVGRINNLIKKARLFSLIKVK